MAKADDYCGAKSCGCKADDYDVGYWDRVKRDNNRELFMQEYLCEWVKDDTFLNSIEICLLHLYTQVYREHPTERDLLAYQINRICHDLEINSDKIIDILPSGRLRPKNFSRHINVENIPEICESAYNKIYELYNKISEEDRKRQEEQEKENKDGYYFLKL